MWTGAILKQPRLQALSRPARNQHQGRAATGDRAAGWRGPAETEAGVTAWPVLYLRARGPANRTGGTRVDTPGGDARQPVPALARRPSDSPRSRRRPSSRPRDTSTFRFNVAAAAPPNGPAGFRERRPAPPSLASSQQRHFRERRQAGAVRGESGGGARLGVVRALVRLRTRAGARARRRCGGRDWARVVMEVAAWRKGRRGSQERHVAES